MNTSITTYVLAWAIIGLYVVRLARKQRQLQCEATAIASVASDLGSHATRPCR